VIEIVCSVLIKLKCFQSLSAVCSTAAASSLVEMFKLISNTFSKGLILGLILWMIEEIFPSSMWFPSPFVHMIAGVSCASSSQERGIGN